MNHPIDSNQIKVWDPLVRTFHWSLVIFFVIAFITEDDWLYLHSFSGYAISGLLLFRLCWGLIGTRYARFSNFVTTPSTVGLYLKSMLRGRPQHYQGHNPAGGMMIVVMLLALLLTAFSGMATLASEGLGPLADTFFASFSGDWMEEIHEALANLCLLLVAIHLAGVIVSSVVHRENLIKAMIDGRKRPQQEKPL
ncbi:MAG: cytochrome b/b6 domain-containing protein [Halopseudomonas sp.]